MIVIYHNNIYEWHIIIYINFYIELFSHSRILSRILSCIRGIHIWHILYKYYIIDMSHTAVIESDGKIRVAN